MAARGDSDRAAPAATETPVLEALHLRASVLAAPPALGRSSSQSSSSSSGSRRRFVVGRQTPFLRRSMAQDSDPCMLGSSFDGWSDDEEEEKTENDGENHRTRTAATRPVLQRSRTEQVPVGAHHAADVRAQSDVGLPPTVVPPIAPLNIRVRKVASTSALDLKSVKLTGDASSPAASVSSLPPMLENSFDRVDVELTSVVEEGGSADDDRDHGDEMLRAGRFTSEQLTDPMRHSLLTYTAAAPPPPASAPSGRMGWLFAWTSPRFRRWYGRILNSYFAFWLVACTVVVALIQLVLLLTAMLLNNEKTRESSVDPTCHTLGLRSLHYLAAVACMLLVLPVVSPIDAFRLYHKRDADRRMVRLPYLHVCELFVTVEVMYLIFFLLHRGYKLPQTVVCHSNYTKSERMFLYGTFTLWGVLWWQLIVFSRFLVHLKLQADAANESTHTSALSDWLRVSNTRELTASKAARPVQRFKKLLYRAAARGDTDAVNDLLDAASLESFGIDGADGVRALYASSPTLWLFAFAVSCKNPLHIAAKRGHVEIVDKLLSLGFDANALDKVARVNFNMGLLFKLATRMLSTQDGDKALLKPVLCSVLLPPLHGAVAAGHVDVVRLLLEKGAANPNALPRASFYYPSAVIPAIFVADDPEIVKLLVAKGANFLHVATTTLSGLASNTYATALQRSALTQRSATTEYLLSCGGDVALTPLHAAAAADNVRTVKRLLRRRERGRDRSPNSHVNARGERVEGVQRRTPLHWAAVVGRAAAAEALLERGADPDARDRYGRTPLHWAAHNNHADVVALLLEHGADAQAQDDGGVPVLSFAAESEGVEQRVIAALLERGASLKHALPGSGDTPLHIALVRENRATATALIRLGADLLAVNSYGKRAVDVTTSTRLLFDLKKQAATRDVMISYPHSHFAFAQRVREYLETHGKLTCWMDTMDPSGIGGGAVWREEIARGIHNCSLVVSIVCGGYTTSEWCLKELALAKMIRKPVIALLVEPPVSVVDVETDADEISVLDAFVPRDHQLPFHSFVRGTCVMDKSVELDVDDAELDAVWRDVLPRLKNAMQTPDHTNGRWLKSHSTVSSTLGSSGIGGIGGRRFDSRTESVVEGDEAGKSGDGEDDERKTDDMDDTVSQASSLGLSTDSTRKQLSVAVYSTLSHSVLLERLVQDMGSEGFRARALTVDTHDDAQFTHQLTAFRVLVVVVESLGDDASREQRQAAGAQLATLLRAAAGVPNGLRVCPVVVREEFLSFSNLYTLARSELLYFVSGAGERQATKALLRQLRRAAATDSK